MPTDGVVTSTPNTPQYCIDSFNEATINQVVVEEHHWCSAAERYATCINGLTNLRSPKMRKRYLIKLRAWFRHKPSCDVESLING
ncbi:hypothetical protein RRG08_005039 [Elysia crispata]|uniref:Uncharacterized protein n=1 Tax=Elysia crispata TaxID=231223 RepID=A0AAE0YZP3_9GAST|nr:hypothetical protein RRG08_005039 [Elysia crispata]